MHCNKFHKNNWDRIKSDIYKTFDHGLTVAEARKYIDFYANCIACAN